MCHCHPVQTFKAQVSHVQDGGQQLRNLPCLRLREHEDLHGGQDAGVFPQVVPAVTFCAVTLNDTCMIFTTMNLRFDNLTFRKFKN